MATFFRSDGWVKSVIGNAVPGAQIYVCSPQPANVAVLPPSPLASIFSDVNGLVPIIQPIITDGFGHYDFYASQGLYTLVVGIGGVISQVYIDQNIGAAGGGSAGQTLVAGSNITIVGNVISAVIPPPPSSLTLQTNGTNNTIQNLLNLKSGSGASVTSDGAGGVTVSATGTLPPSVSSVTGFGNWSGFRTIPNGGNSLGAAFYGTAAAAPQTGTTPLLQVDATATDTNYCSISSTASANTIGGYNATSSLLGPTLGGILSYQCRVQLQQSTQIRAWTGLVDSNSAVVQNLKATNPNQNIVGFRYDTSFGDTGWVGYCSTSNLLVSTSGTGPAMDTLGHSLAFKVINNGASIVFFVDGVSIGTVSTNIPAASTHLSLVGAVDNVGLAQARLMNVSYAVIMDKF